jgi:hypothetical protein
MRCLIAAMLILSACSNEHTSRSREITPESREHPHVAPITDLRFKDDQLQAIATQLTREARLRGIEVSSGETRAERLIDLEAKIGAPGRALDRINVLVSQMTATDVSQWGKLRQRAERDLGNPDDEVVQRVRDMLLRWQREKSVAMVRYLSSNYSTTYITSLDWERRFHEFVRERPPDAATWGWLVLRDYRTDVQQQYGRADAEMAYRFYLEFSGLGDGREARRIFSVPGIDVIEAP